MIQPLIPSPLTLPPTQANHRLTRMPMMRKPTVSCMGYFLISRSILSCEALSSQTRRPNFRSITHGLRNLEVMSSRRMYVAEHNSQGIHPPTMQ